MLRNTSTWTCLCVIAALSSLLSGCQSPEPETPAEGSGTADAAPENSMEETETVDNDEEVAEGMSVSESGYGKTADGQAVTQFSCTNANGR